MGDDQLGAPLNGSFALTGVIVRHVITLLISWLRSPISSPTLSQSSASEKGKLFQKRGQGAMVGMGHSSETGRCQTVATTPVLSCRKPLGRRP